MRKEAHSGKGYEQIFWDLCRVGIMYTEIICPKFCSGCRWHFIVHFSLSTSDDICKNQCVIYVVHHFLIMSLSEINRKHKWIISHIPPVWHHPAEEFLLFISDKGGYSSSTKHKSDDVVTLTASKFLIAPIYNFSTSFTLVSSQLSHPYYSAALNAASLTLFFITKSISQLLRRNKTSLYNVSVGQEPVRTMKT